MDTIKVISWNVNGLQGILKKDVSGKKTTVTNLKQLGTKSALEEMVDKEDPDIICFQEIRCSDKFDHNKITCLKKYPYKYVNHATNRKGYSGTLVVSKLKPSKVHNRFSEDFAPQKGSRNSIDTGLSTEGRLITLEYESFVLVNVYVPNSGVAIRYKDGSYSAGLRRLSWRVDTWETIMRKYISSYMVSPIEGPTTGTSRKTVIVIGDFNVIYSSAAESLDSYKPIINEKFSGSTLEEKEAFGKLLSIGLIDSFRYLHPKEKKLSWHYTSNRNRGYRLDYALVSNENINKIKDSTILNQYLGSDHSPIVLQFLR